MPSPIFSIHKLRCAYHQGRTVLRVDKLDIPSHSLVFIIGPSGVGKSTFVETLGLMNHTAAEGNETSIRFLPQHANAIELAGIWQKPEAALSDIRRKHFSFIFQNTNLMPNFSSGENMAMSLLIKGRSMPEARAEVLRVMERLHLPPEIFDKRITEVSGGQRQRLAFVRAITADFDVLFGDEPTGNLDAGTAISLLKTVREKIQQEGKTGIIVSHDLPLAVRFADVIIPISAQQHENGDLFGTIRPNDILTRTNPADDSHPSTWRNPAGQAIADPLSHLGRFVFQSTATA